MTDENTKINATEQEETPPKRNIPAEFLKNRTVSLDSLDDPSVRPIKTFELDAAKFLKDKNASVSDIALAEQKRRIRQATSKSQEPLYPESNKKSKLILALSLFSLFFILAGGAIIYFVISVQKDRPVLIGTESVASIIPADAEKEIDISIIDATKIKNVLANEKDNVTLSLGKVLGFYFTESAPEGKSLIRTDRFLEISDINPPAGLLRSLSKNFMLGIHSFNGNQPFLILKTNSFQQAYSGMLGWENDLANDLSPLFVSPEEVAEVVADSTETLLAKRSFADSIIKNRDVRALRNPNGKVILLYSIIDKETILITTNEYTFNEIISRLTTKKLIR